MVVELAVDDLLGGLDDHFAELRIELAKAHVGLGAGALHDAERANNGLRLLLPADLEVAERTLGLGAPVLVTFDLDGSERVALGAGLGGHVKHPGLALAFGCLHLSWVCRLLQSAVAVWDVIALPARRRPLGP